MPLPKINEILNYQKIKLPSTKTIGIRGWRVKEEKELLFASERVEEDDVEKAKVITNFLKSCVDDVDKFDTLSENDLKRIAVELRKISKGDDIEYVAKCTNTQCGYTFDDTLRLSKVTKIKDFDPSPIKISENLIFAMKEIALDKVIELHNRFKDEPVKLLYYYLINSIEAVTYDKQTYTEFTEDEMIEFVDQLTSDELNILNVEFEKKSSKVSLEKKVKCKSCNSDINIVIEDVLSFLVL